MATVTSDSLEARLEEIEVQIDEEELEEMQRDPKMHDALRTEHDVFQSERKECLANIVATLCERHPEYLELFGGRLAP